MGSGSKIVSLVLTAEALRFAETCAGGKDISRVVESGLELLWERLLVLDEQEQSQQDCTDVRFSCH